MGNGDDVRRTLQRVGVADQSLQNINVDAVGSDSFDISE